MEEPTRIVDFLANVIVEFARVDDDPLPSVAIKTRLVCRET